MLILFMALYTFVEKASLFRYKNVFQHQKEKKKKNKNKEKTRPLQAIKISR